MQIFIIRTGQAFTEKEIVAQGKMSIALIPAASKTVSSRKMKMSSSYLQTQ